jgi:geranylgeranyl diphosphate synthase type II
MFGQNMNKNDYEVLAHEVNLALVEGLDPGKGKLEEAIHYSLSVKGKRLRPVLFLTLLEAYGIETGDYMDVACAIEYIHTYSLIHDDHPSMDNDDVRRGMPTVHKKYNDAIALLAGDTLLTMAFERIAKTALEPRQTVKILKIVTAGIGLDGMAGGQALDLDFSGDKDLILSIHRMKTAELIKASLVSAGVVAGLSDEEIESLGEAAISIGIAFQMADDLLDMYGDEKEVGKKLQKDGDNQSPNSVIFFGREYIENEVKRLYNRTMEILERLGITHPPLLGLMKKMVFRTK